MAATVTLAASATMSARQIARAAGIAPRTKRFVLRDAHGLAYDGGRSTHVLAALQRSDKTPGLDQTTRMAAMGLWKCYTTGRMSPELARHVRETCTPYQLCAMVARIAASAGPDATIGHLADTWINAHALELAAGTSGTR